MICKFCGNVIDDNSDFCFICGQKNPGEEASVVSVAVENTDVFSQASAAYDEDALSSDSTVPAEFDGEEFGDEVFEDEAYEDASEPVYGQPTSIYAQSAPVYAQQVIIQQVAPAQIVKSKSGKNSGEATKGSKFFAVILSALFVLQFIPWIWYNKAKKAGEEQKAIDLLNSIMIGLCIFMFVVGLVIGKTFLL